MNGESVMLYKLIVLYMLKFVTFPLTKAQIGDFILEKDYTNFMNLQKAFSEMEDGGYVVANSVRNRTHLRITEEGKEVLALFESRINAGIKKDIEDYLNANCPELRRSVEVQGNYQKLTNGEYQVDLMVKEKESELLHISLLVPIEDIAITTCNNWQKRSEKIYQYLTKNLF